jgi:hypothetical protein
VGALGPAAFAAWWLPLSSGRGFLPPVVLLMAVLPLTVSALFLLSWTLRDRGASPGRRRPLGQGQGGRTRLLRVRG